MALILKQSTAVDVLIGPFVDSTDGFTAEVGVSPAVKLSKNGQTLAAKNDITTPVHDADGYYNCELDATDTNTVGQLVATVVGSATSLPVRHEFYVVEEAVYDAMYGASAAGPLQSTVAARTLDVTATGAAGIDWANVENPTTAVDLSATDIQLSDTTTTVTNGVALAATATSAQLVDDVWDEVLTGGTHNVVNSAGRRLRFLQEAGAYAGAIWIDTVNGAAGTTDFENGTDTNPVDTIADANTLAASLGISRFNIAPGSSITLAATQANQMFMGSSWTLALGGQSIDGSTFIGAAVSGIATNTAGTQYFVNCEMGAVTLPGDTHVLESAISGTQTLGEAGDFFWDRCHSGIAGTSTPVLDFGSALNSSNVNMRNYSGGLEIQNMGAGTGSYAMSLEGRGQLVINANCSATSSVAIRGLFTVTDNAGGAVTLSDDARIDVGQINGEVVDVLKTDTSSLAAQGAPSATPTLEEALLWVYKLGRNKLETTATTISVYDDAGTTVDHKSTISDDATTFTRGEFATGP